MKSIDEADVRVVLSDGTKAPQYQTENSAGVDMCSMEDWVLEPGERKRFMTGLSMKIPDGYEAQIRPRSGLAMNYGVTVLNSPSTIDSDYVGKVGVLLINHGKNPFTVNVGDRIAQLVFARVARATFSVVDELEKTARGAGGWGSTGVK